MQIGVYKMKKILTLFLILTLGVGALFACGDGSEKAPEGLQVVKISEEDGYKFYGPEGWSIVSTDKIAATKVSPINNTSITFTEADMPVGSIPEYFEESLAEFPSSIKDTMKITLRDEKCSFGNADNPDDVAYKYIYTYKYENYDFACMQILLTHANRFYIFTYTSYGDVEDPDSTYNSYLKSVQLAIDSFCFTERTPASAPSYEKDADGYNLVSDRALSGFDLYLPADYEVVYSSAYVKAKISSGANISLSKATQTGIGIANYLEMRKSDMQKFTTNFTDVQITLTKKIPEDSETLKNWKFDVLPTSDTALSFGDLSKDGIIAYEYTYVFNGQTYHVYQVMGVDSLNGYVFTYTALEDEYSAHIDEIKTILQKVRF